ncbi:hypothetical protein QQF64_033297 [Cirrhinus molitorella]|uniref:Uncharacterized protein n=1 Tax=Cirrhinus molitorella TaxID=172907 RepID=A0ABR3MTG3_9TELE
MSVLRHVRKSCLSSSVGLFRALERAARNPALECELTRGAVPRCAHHTSMWMFHRLQSDTVEAVYFSAQRTEDAPHACSESRDCRLGVNRLMFSDSE